MRQDARNVVILDTAPKHARERQEEGEEQEDEERGDEKERADAAAPFVARELFPQRRAGFRHGDS
jgi:hypothetical protein